MILAKTILFIINLCYNRAFAVTQKIMNTIIMNWENVVCRFICLILAHNHKRIKARRNHWLTDINLFPMSTPLALYLNKNPWSQTFRWQTKKLAWTNYNTNLHSIPIKYLYSHKNRHVNSYSSKENIEDFPIEVI